MDTPSERRKESIMTDDLAVILDYGGRPFTSGNRENANRFYSALAHGYIHEGMGGGISMDKLVLAVRDLLAIGFDADMASSIGREAMERRLAELVAAWPEGKDRVRREAEFNRAVLQYDFGANCSCENDGDRRRLDRPVQKLWTGPDITG